MKKLFFITLSIALILTGIAFVAPNISRATSLPDNMVVTYTDINNANKNNEFSSFINLELPKNLKVTDNNELTQTEMSIKLFNLFTLKKINVRLLVDTDVYVGGETVGFNLFSEGVICVGSNTVVTENGTKEPLRNSGIEDGDAIIKIADIEIESIQDIDRIINLPELAGKELTLNNQANREWCENFSVDRKNSPTDKFVP